jgi:biopolymer transport protein ExbB/TolQ
MVQQNTISIILSILILLSPFLLRRKQSVSNLSSLVVTFGILGTFIGIFLGLITFQVTDIYGSVPKLLEGLKIAFLTSIAGMIAGVLVKVFPAIYRIKIEETSDDSAIESMIRILNEINANQIEISKRETEQLRKIERALCGEGDTTLLTQIQKLRTLISDKQDDLIKEFREFAKTMAENNSKALIDALTQVMRDFNTKINEQFGENFKQLNDAVGKILIWQENYKEQIELMIKQFEKSIEGIDKTEKSISNIQDEFSKIAKTGEDLKSLITIFTYEIETIDAVSKSAKNAFPIIEENIKKLTKDFSDRVNLATEELNNITKRQKDSSNQQVQLITETSKNLSDNVTKILSNMNSQIDSFMKQNAERIAKQVSELDKALQEELTKSLNSLASQLGSLSNKFSQDYTPITNKLKEIIQSLDGRK